MKDKVKEFIDNKCIFIFDTNIYLNLYEYSPHIADFFVDIISIIKNQIYIPSTVKREFDKNHKECQGRQKKKFQNVPKALKKYTEQAKSKICNQLDILEKFKFPDIDDLKNISVVKLSEIEDVFLKYVEEHDVFQEINKKFLEDDRVLDLFYDICSKGRLLKSFDLDDIYLICEEGKARYLKSIPPGFEDAKTKDGIEKYNDLIIWKETIQFCKNECCSLIFVTDDIKPDWWTQSLNQKGIFHELLVKEFEKQTNQKILGITSYELFTILADIFKVQVPDTIESILKFSVEDYVEGLFENDELKDYISSELSYSNESYVNTDSLSHYDGSYFEIDDEVDSIELIEFEFEGYKENKAIYLLKVSVKVNARSREYWGKDDETKEVILSDDYYIHALEGEIEVRLIRDVDSYLEDLINDTSFTKIDIIFGSLSEIGGYSTGDLCVECGKNFGEVAHRNGGLVCMDCAVVNEEGDICPECGEKVPYDLMAGNGFCIRCTEKSDYL
ncbi:MAG: PIN-like domain-containing protein [Lutisporaceae bacterium]